MIAALKVAARHVLVRLARASFRLRSTPLQLSPGPLLIVAPHADDETLGCGALIGRERAVGRQVHVLFLTDGSASHRNMPVADLIARRRHEALAALQELGVSADTVAFGPLKDGTLNRLSAEGRAQLTDLVSDAISRIHPAHVFVPCSPDGSSEHDVVASFVRAPATAMGATMWEYPVWLWRQPQVLMARVRSPGQIRRHDAGPFLEKKLRAFARYHSQVNSNGRKSGPVVPRELQFACLASPEYYFLSGAHT